MLGRGNPADCAASASCAPATRLVAGNGTRSTSIAGWGTRDTGWVAPGPCSAAALAAGPEGDESFPPGASFAAGTPAGLAGVAPPEKLRMRVLGGWDSGSGKLSSGAFIVAQTRLEPGRHHFVDAAPRVPTR
jgi:hypothetical protein